MISRCRGFCRVISFLNKIGDFSSKSVVWDPFKNELIAILKS